MNAGTVLLDAVTEVGAGTAVIPTWKYSIFTAYYKAASVTTGGTVAIQAKSPAGDWVTIDSRAITEDGDTVVQFSGFYSELRGNVTARTDGTYTLSIHGGS